MTTAADWLPCADDYCGWMYRFAVLVLAAAVGFAGCGDDDTTDSIAGNDVPSAAGDAGDGGGFETAGTPLFACPDASVVSELTGVPMDVEASPTPDGPSYCGYVSEKGGDRLGYLLVQAEALPPDHAYRNEAFWRDQDLRTIGPFPGGFTACRSTPEDDDSSFVSASEDCVAVAGGVLTQATTGGGFSSDVSSLATGLYDLLDL